MKLFFPHDGRLSPQAGGGRKKRIHLSNEQGSIAPLLLGLMVVLLTINMAILSLSQTQSRFIREDGKRLSAVHLAEAGLDHILWRLRQPSDPLDRYGVRWRTLEEEQDVDLPGGQYRLARIDQDGGGGVTGFLVEGWVPHRNAANAVSAQIYAELAPVYLKPWAGAVLGDQGVPVANGNTDSYDASVGPYGGSNVRANGDVATNNPAAGSISLSSNGYVSGNVYYPRNGSPNTVSGDSGNVSGTIGFNPADTRFAPIPSAAESARQWGHPTVSYLKPITSSPPKFVLTDSTGTATGATLPSPILPGVYVIKKDPQGDSIKLSGSGGITFNASDPTVLYLEGNADLSGNGIQNVSTRPSNLLIYGLPACTGIKIAGNANFYGAVYAPQADITMRGGGSLGAAFGSLAGKTVSFSGNGTILHYDESLRFMPGVLKKYKLHTWTQLK